MKFNQIKEMVPALVGTNGALVEDVTKEELASAGVAFSGAGMGVGDTVEFLDEYDFVNDVKKVQVRPNSNSWDYRVLAIKNGKPEWLSLGFFCRRDEDMKPVHPVSEALNELHDHGARIEFLRSKGVMAAEKTKYQAPKFEADGTRVDGATVERSTAVCVFA